MKKIVEEIEPMAWGEDILKSALQEGELVTKGYGLCRYCLKVIKLLKNGKHLRTHYYSHLYAGAQYGYILTPVLEYDPKEIVRCHGSRSLDYANKYLLDISDSFEKI